jgi:epoxyqueuosine reductase QueG
MNKERIIKIAAEFTAQSAKNRIEREIALREDIIGMKIFEEPIFAFGAADDASFLLLKKRDVIGEHFILPKEWLPEAKGVISFFLPFTARVKKSNAGNMSEPSSEWLHARIEGQSFIAALCRLLQTEMLQAGYQSIAPSLDERFCAKNFSSNWSERHIAFLLGLEIGRAHV